MASKRKPPRQARGGVEEGAYERRISRRRDADDAGEPLDSDRDRPRSSRWWSASGEALTSAVWGWVERLKSRHRRQILMDALWEAVYKDAPFGTSVDGGYGAVALRTQQARQNIAASMVDTVTSRLGKRRPMPVISADDAGHQERLFAKRASRVLRRKMGQSAVERLCPTVLRDGVIRGTGAAKVYRNGGDVDIERVPRREIIVDPAEAQYGTPRTMAQVKRVDRDVLCGLFPDHEAQIRVVSRASFDEWRTYEEVTDADQVDVIEAWHLPSVPGAKDGRHVICIRGCEPLRDEKWTRQRFPFAFFHWSEPIDGFWGSGLIEAIAPIQQEVNQLLGQLGEGITLGMALKIFSPRGSHVEKSHLRARNPAVIEHDGGVPQYVAPLPFNPAVLQYIQWRISQGYEMSGVSQATAASKSALGNQASGKALDTQYDIESDRFGDKELGYAMFRVDLGRCMIDEARDIAQDDEIKESEKAEWIRKTDWKRVEVDEGPFHLILEPINFVPDARSGKLATVNEMASAGLLTDPMQIAALFDEPDIARANRHLLGPYRMLEKWTELLGDEDYPLEQLTPTPLIVAHVQLATQMCEGELANVIAEEDEDHPNDVVQERYRWALSMLEAEAKQAAAPPPGAPAPGMGAPAPMDPTAMPGGPMPPAAPGMDPMGGMTAQLAAGMQPPPGTVLS